MRRRAPDHLPPAVHTRHWGEPRDRPPEMSGLSSHAEGAGELAAAADIELPVDVAEVPLDVLDRHEQCVGDLPVALAAGGELGHATLAGREPAAGVGWPRSPPARQP